MKALHSGEALTADGYLKCLRRRTNKCLKKNSKRLQGQTSEKVKWGVYSTYIIVHHDNAYTGKAKPREASSKQKKAAYRPALAHFITHSLTHSLHFNILYVYKDQSSIYSSANMCSEGYTVVVLCVGACLCAVRFLYSAFSRL